MQNFAKCCDVSIFFPYAQKTAKLENILRLFFPFSRLLRTLLLAVRFHPIQRAACATSAQAVSPAAVGSKMAAAVHFRLLVSR